MQKVKINKYGKALILFLALMVVFTIISRAADSVTVARVSTESLKRGMLVHRAEAAGVIQASQMEYVPGVKDFRITRIHVGAGSRVEAGDVLFTLNGDEIREKIEAAESSLATMNLELKRLQLEQANTASSQSAVETAQQELDRAIADDDFNRSINDGRQLLSDQRAIEDAEKKLADAKASQQEIQEKSGVDIELKQLEIQNKQKELNKLKALLANDGVIAAEIAGTIGEIFVTQGTISTGEDLCTIVPDDAPLEFEGSLTIKDAEYMKAGETVKVKLAGQQYPVRNELTIKSLVKDGDNMKLTIDMSEVREVELGLSATAEHESRSQEYSTLVSLSALNGSENDHYVLVLREKNTVLGTQTVAEAVPVTLINKDRVNAAVEGMLDSSDRIITGSSKMIVEGDRVREVQ